MIYEVSVLSLLASIKWQTLQQASAYGEAFDPNIKVEVNGDVEAAKKLITKEEDARIENFSDSENDQDQQEVRIMYLFVLRLYWKGMDSFGTESLNIPVSYS